MCCLHAEIIQNRRSPRTCEHDFRIHMIFIYRKLTKPFSCWTTYTIHSVSDIKILHTYSKTDLFPLTSFLISSCILDWWWVSLPWCWASSGCGWIVECWRPLPCSYVSSRFIMWSSPIVIIIGMWVRCIHALKPGTSLWCRVNGRGSGGWGRVVYSRSFGLFTWVWVNRYRGSRLHLLVQCVSTASNMHTCKQYGCKTWFMPVLGKLLTF